MTYKIFFSRSVIDLDYNLPHLCEFEDIFIYMDKDYVLTPDLKHIIEDSQISIFQPRLLVRILNNSRMFRNLCRLIASAMPSFADKIAHVVSDIKCSDMLTNLQRNSALDKPLELLFDHDEKRETEILINRFRVRHPLGVKAFSYPHAISIFANRMIDIEMLRPPKKIDLRFYDCVYASTEDQASVTNADSMEVLPPLRYKKEWLYRFDDAGIRTGYPNGEYEKLVKRFTKSKVPILFIHSKSSGNVSHEETVRILKMLEKSDRFVVFLKLHPRITSTERKNLTIQNGVLIEDGVVSSWLRLFRHVIAFQTTSIHEALIRGNIVHLPTFAMSNRLQDQYVSRCKIYTTPDELSQFVFHSEL